MKKFKWIALLCVTILCLTFVFAGCIDPNAGNDDGDDKVITEKWWEDTGELSFNSEGKVKYSNITIKLATVVSGEDKDTFKSIIDDFNREYKGRIAIDSEDIGQANFESTVAQRISTKNKAPDLIMSHQKGHKYFVENKIIQPFNKDLMEQSKISIDMNDYSAGLSRYSSLGYKDELFSIPCDAQSMVVFYNKTLLKEIGKELPTNHQELLDVCKAFVELKGTSPIAWPAANQNNHWYNYVFTTAIMQNGGKLYDENTKKADWTSEPNKTAMTKSIQSIRDLVDSDGVVKYAPFNDKTSDYSSQFEFADNKALFYVYFPWRIESLESLYKTRNNVQDVTDIIGTTSIANWFAMDSSSADAGKIFVDSHFFAMSKLVTDVSKKAAIMEFIKWFTQRTDVCKKWASTGHITACKLVGDTEEYKNDAYCQRYLNNFYPDIDNLVSMGLTSHYNTVLSHIKTLGHETLSNTAADIESKLASIQKSFNDEIAMNK